MHVWGGGSGGGVGEGGHSADQRCERIDHVPSLLTTSNLFTPRLQVEVCCFDKTGTLTTDHLLLEGIAGVPGHSQEELLVGKGQAALPPQVARVLATCHALVQVGRRCSGGWGCVCACDMCVLWEGGRNGKTLVAPPPRPKCAPSCVPGGWWG